METPALVPLAALAGWHAALNDLFLGVAEPEDLPARLTPLLLGLAAGSAAAGCRLFFKEKTVTALADAAGRPLGAENWARSAAAPSDPYPRHVTLTIPGGEVRSLVIPIGGPDSRLGELLLAGGLSSDTDHEVVTVLGLAADELAVRLHLAGARKLADLLRKERDELETLATVGEAVDGLTHEFSNILNSMMLQASVIALQVSDKLKGELGVISQQGSKAAGFLRRLRQLRQRPRGAANAADLNAVIRELTIDGSAFAGRVTPVLAGSLPTLPVNPVDLKRLVRCLLTNMIAGRSGGEPPVTVRTEPVGAAGVRLGLEDQGGHLHDVALQSPLEPGGAFDTIEEHERLVVQTLLRRLNARLTVENRTPHGVTMAVEWA